MAEPEQSLVAAGEGYEPYVPVRQRRQEQLARVSAKRRQPTAAELQQQEAAKQERKKEKRGGGETLLQTHGRLVRNHELLEEDEVDRQLRLEAEILRSIRNTKKLMSVEELAKGIRYTEPLPTSWRPPAHVRGRREEVNRKIRERRHMLVESESLAWGQESGRKKGKGN